MLKGKTIYVRPLEGKDAEENLRLQSENRDFFEQFSMIRADDYYTVEGQRKRITEYQERFEKDEEYHFGIFTASDDRLIGTVFALSNHPWRAANCVHRVFFRQSP